MRDRARPLVEPTGIRFRDLCVESLITLAAKPARTLMTMLGTILGVGCFVTVLGLTTTATGQITEVFSALRATEVNIEDKAQPDIDGTVFSFPHNADTLARTVNGVTAAGITWPLNRQDVTTGLDPRLKSTPINVAAASPGYLRALEPTLASGTLFNDFQNQHSVNVAVIGKALAQSLGITSTTLEPTLFLDNVGYRIIGIMNGARRLSTADNTLYIPAVTALTHYGKPQDSNRATMLITTQLGAADQVATQLPIALRPTKPEDLHAIPAQTDVSVQNNISNVINPIFLALAALILFVGAIGITNSTLISILARTQEIGLRRALGARPIDIYTQVLLDTIVTGTLGGLIGTALAILTVLTTALTMQWTAILDPTITLAAPLIGTITGALAGTYPATRAARTEPIQALHR